MQTSIDIAAVAEGLSAHNRILPFEIWPPYNSTRMPRLKVRPSRGTHTSVMGLPPGRGVGRISGAKRVWRTSVKVNRLRKIAIR